MVDPRHSLGRTSEEAVAAWLTSAGWRVLGRRARLPGVGEIDVLALDPTLTLVAVEVRARRTRRTGAAALSVDARRVARLRRSLAAAMGATAGLQIRGLRVDIVSVEPAGEAGFWRLTRVPAVG